MHTIFLQFYLLIVGAKWYFIHQTACFYYINYKNSYKLHLCSSYMSSIQFILLTSAFNFLTWNENPNTKTYTRIEPIFQFNNAQRTVSLQTLKHLKFIRAANCCWNLSLEFILNGFQINWTFYVHHRDAKINWDFEFVGRRRAAKRQDI